MSNASFKDQLKAVATQMNGGVEKMKKPRPQPSRVSAPKNPKPKPKWLEYVQYGVELLRAYFPATFKYPSDVKPLKKGIKEDLVKRLSTLEQIVTEDKACMVKSLSYYVNTIHYHKCIVAGAARYDLDGKESGVVTEEEANYSIERCKEKNSLKQQVNPKQSEQVS